MRDLNRRQLLQATGAGLALGALAPLARLAAGQDQSAGYELPKLPYAFDALEPYIDARTMEIHHDRHHKAYVDNLNKAVAKHPVLFKKSVVELLRDIANVPKDIRTAVINNGGGHANHSLFWEVMAPKGGGEPSGDLAKAIGTDLGGFDKFKQDLSQSAITRFGSGWGWLVVNNGKLTVLSTGNQDSPLMKGQTPILGIDVWEHAYYLRYQNMRPKYIEAWWNTVNWANVAERYQNAMKG